MKNKRRKIVIFTILIIAIIALLFYYFMFNFKNKNSFTLEENKWIDSNKYNVIDIAVLSDIPILSVDGSGMFYDYIEYVGKQKSLKFNIIPYKLGTEANYDYKVDIVADVTSNDISLYKDNLILLTNDNKEYSNLDGLSNLKIGIIADDKDLLTKYFNNSSIQLIEYNNYTDLKNEFIKSKAQVEANMQDVSINGIVIPKLIFTKEIIQNDYVVSYHFDDLSKYFVLKIDDSSELNSIMRKSYNLWKESNYKESYNKNLLNNYFEFKKLSDTEQKKLQSKSYVYGFINYGIYNSLDGNKISGFNKLILKDFNKFSGLSIKYIKFNSLSKLIKNFNSKKIDFVMNLSKDENYKVNVYKTNGAYSEKLLVISGLGNKDVINNIYSLKDKEVLTIKDSYIEKYLIENSIKVKSYNNLKDLTIDFKENDIVIIDLENYNYYKTSTFKNSKINYIFNINDKYNYLINDTDDNKLFEKIFNFYINYNSINKLIIENYDNIAYQNINVIYVLIFIIIVLSIYLVLDFSNHVKVLFKRIKKKNKVHLTKEEKIKYIDQLTSLKNRAYLNSRIESWDESEIYPQGVIVIDLNNVAYINDNYGREEGDKVITEAANILIQHQLQNSEIIRTDGNEFLIYLVGYSEKQIISYLRRLNKQLKGLSHGFGAASGYSIILDAIKTFDDAVNEATNSMKENKEDIDY